MQATIATFDEHSFHGTVLLDEGTELAFEPPAFTRSGLRHLRSGQRVSIDADSDGVVQRLYLVGID